MKKSSLAVACLGVGVSLFGFGLQSNAANVQVGRYVTVAEEASIAEQNALQQTVLLTFPESVQTVGEAMSYLLASTSYQVIPQHYRTRETDLLLAQRLPLSDRTLGPITVTQALLALSGQTYQLVVDPRHRYVSIVLKPKFHALASE